MRLAPNYMPTYGDLLRFDELTSGHDFLDDRH